LASIPDGFGKRAFAAMDKGFNDHNLMIRITGETLAVTPPLIITDNEIDELVSKLAAIIKAVA
jgi:beta-alanine--pyruvate transaminase